MTDGKITNKHTYVVASDSGQSFFATFLLEDGIPQVELRGKLTSSKRSALGDLYLVTWISLQADIWLEETGVGEEWEEDELERFYDMVGQATMNIFCQLDNPKEPDKDSAPQ